MQDWYKDKPWTTLFVDGNHENHFLLSSYPVEKWNGGDVHKINDSIIHLMRGQYYEIDGRTFWTMGGANSTDKECRKEWISWWAAECPSYAEMDLGIENLAAHDNKVDVILTHEAPLWIARELYGYGDDNLQKYLDHIFTNCKYKQFFFGHHHCDFDLPKLGITAVYNKIWEI